SNFDEVFLLMHSKPITSLTTDFWYPKVYL
ncbi:MAG: hypothetical protein ACJAUZ_003337, partial [Flavobacteriaceae bacterium]